MGWIISIGFLIGACIIRGDVSVNTLLISSGLFAIAGSMPRQFTINGFGQKKE